MALIHYVTEFYFWLIPVTIKKVAGGSEGQVRTIYINNIMNKIWWSVCRKFKSVLWSFMQTAAVEMDAQLLRIFWLLLSKSCLLFFEVNFHDNNTKWNSWLGSQNSELNSFSTELQLFLSDSTESSVCLRTSRRRIMQIQNHASQMWVCTHLWCPAYIYVWLQPHMTTLLNGLFTCGHMWLKKLALGNSHMKVLRDYVLWRGNHPWKYSTLLPFCRNPTEDTLKALIQKCLSNSYYYDTRATIWGLSGTV